MIFTDSNFHRQTLLLSLITQTHVFNLSVLSNLNQFRSPAGPLALEFMPSLLDFEFEILHQNWLFLVVKHQSIGINVFSPRMSQDAGICGSFPNGSVLLAVFTLLTHSWNSVVLPQGKPFIPDAFLYFSRWFDT